MQAAAAIDDDRHFRRQGEFRLRNRAPQVRGQAAGIDHGLGIVTQRPREHRNTVGCGDVEAGDLGRKQRRRGRRQPAHLQAAARGDFHGAVAPRARHRA